MTYKIFVYESSVEEFHDVLHDEQIHYSTDKDERGEKFLFDDSGGTSGEMWFTVALSIAKRKGIEYVVLNKPKP